MEWIAHANRTLRPASCIFILIHCFLYRSFLHAAATAAHPDCHFAVPENLALSLLRTQYPPTSTYEGRAINGLTSSRHAALIIHDLYCTLPGRVVAMGVRARREGLRGKKGRQPYTDLLLKSGKKKSLSTNVYISFNPRKVSNVGEDSVKGQSKQTIMLCHMQLKRSICSPRTEQYYRIKISISESFATYAQSIIYY